MALPLAQNLTQLTNYWLNEMNQYEPILYFDLDTLVNLMEKEPLALTAVAIAFLNIVFTIFFKVSDYFKELWKERNQRAQLHIEAHPIVDPDTLHPAIHVVLTNTGKEPVVIRDVGYQKRPLILRLVHNFSPINIRPVYLPFERIQAKIDLPDASWPVAIHPREFFEFTIRGQSLGSLKKACHRFTVRDSLGTLWLYRGASIARFVQQNPTNEPSVKQKAKAVRKSKTRSMPKSSKQSSKNPVNASSAAIAALASVSDAQMDHHHASPSEAHMEPMDHKILVGAGAVESHSESR